MKLSQFEKTHRVDAVRVINMNNDIPTPRTDVNTPVGVYDKNGQFYAANLVSADFARGLERELAEAEKERVRMRDWAQEERRGRLSAETILMHQRVNEDAWLLERDKLISQLPSGMENCTIIVKRCHKGHVWLTADNWIDCECQRCRIIQMESQLAQHEPPARSSED